jgi:hypothetical protein
MVSSTNFYQLDVGTLTATLIGPLNNGAGLMIDLCFANDGTCWAYDLGNDDAGNINIATGNYTVLGPLGYDANFGQGMAYDRETGTIYMSAFNNTTFTGQLRTMDPGTGATALVTDWGFEQIAPFALDTDVGGGGACNLLFDDFEAGLGNWTITNDGGTCVWTQNDILANSYTLGSTGASGFLLAADSDICGSGSTLLSTATAGPFDATGLGVVVLDFDHDWRTIQPADEAHVEVSLDGSTWSSVMSWVGVDQRDSHESFDISAMVGNSMFWLRFRTVQPGWDWWWVIDNVCLDGVIPVELVSFAAIVNEQDVNLSWSTATELNNQGFDIERAVNGNYEVVGYVQGYGTTTETQFYSFTDQNVNVGQYTYRLKQIDFDGTSTYSDEIEVDVTVPKVFALDQNYPNPFNPSTKIKFSLAVDSKVTLAIFDVLGQEVSSLIDADLAAGGHEVDFNAASINSGIYFYRIEATGSDGTNFVDVKKMTLIK